MRNRHLFQLLHDFLHQNARAFAGDAGQHDGEFSASHTRHQFIVLHDFPRQQVGYCRQRFIADVIAILNIVFVVVIDVQNHHIQRQFAAEVFDALVFQANPECAKIGCAGQFIGG